MDTITNPEHRNQFDAIVVGAGPAGSTFAAALARASFRVALLEEHSQVGVPTHCSGLVSPRALEIAGVSPEGMGLCEYSQARVWAPGGGTLWLRSDSVQAIAIERDQFDQLLAQRAVEAGAELILSTKARHFQRDDGQICVRATTPRGELQIRAPLLVGADGANSRVARWMGAARSPGAARWPGADGRHEIIPAIKADLTFTGGGPDTIEILVGSDVAPGWFGWVIPLPGGRATAGMGATRSPRRHFPAFLDLVRQRFGDFTLDGTHSALIPLGPARDFVADGVLLVGAAARQTKPTTGGGVYLGIRAAQLAADAAARALAREDLSRHALAPYEDAWHRLEGREVAVGHRLRRAYRRLSDRQLDWIVATAAQPWAQRLISRLGDIDFPAQLLSALLHNLPRVLWPYLPFERSHDLASQHAGQGAGE